LPAAVGVPKQIETAIEKIKDPIYTTAVGLILYSSRNVPEKSKVKFPSFSSVGNVTGKMRGWLKALLP
jgi:hypothetical protein